LKVASRTVYISVSVFWNIIQKLKMSPVTREQFEKAAAIVSDKTVTPVRKASYAEKCRLYGLYKRGTLGKLNPPYGDDDIDTDSRPKSRPGMLSVEARSKYDAWAATDDMSKQEAQGAYFNLAEDLVGPPVADLKK
jgi:acyl-CoA-binding protein